MLRLVLVLTLFLYSEILGEFANSKWLKVENNDIEIVYPRITRTRHEERHLTKRTVMRMDEYVENQITENENIQNVPIVIVVRGDNKTFFFELYPVEVISPNFTVYGNEGMDLTATGNCLYRGRVISHLPGLASFSICDGDDAMYGSWITKDGHYVLRPNLDESDLENEDNPPGHKLYKLRNRSLQTEDTYCGTSIPKTDNLDTEQLEEKDEEFRFKRAAFASKVIETAVFADSALNNKFQKKYKGNAFQKLTSYIMAVVNEVQLIYDFDSMETKFKLVLVRLEVLKPATAARYSGKTTNVINRKGAKSSTPKKAMQTSKGTSNNAPNTGGGDIDKYLDNFCNWQAKKDPSEGKTGHWDHAIMLTGLDLYKSTGKKKNNKVLGQAWLDGMCIPKYSCTINEGDDFEAAYVISHEMGHNLGMPHDGAGNNCDANKFIMSPVTGAGKITWSTCSNKALKKFLNKDQVRTCLSDDAVQPPRFDFDKNGQLPGQEYPPDAQCKLAMGKNYAAYMPNKKPYSNICRELWCITGMTATTTHPALDGSSCENGRMCRQGKCT